MIFLPAISHRTFWKGEESGSDPTYEQGIVCPLRVLRMQEVHGNVGSLVDVVQAMRRLRRHRFADQDRHLPSVQVPRLERPLRKVLLLGGPRAQVQGGPHRRTAIGAHSERG